jgi:hypothetical protein
MKNITKRGQKPKLTVVKNSCGKKGCDARELTLPYGITTIKQAA